MHDARGIANYLLDRAASKALPITSMTLLKVLYFAHAWHLAKFDTPLVAQPFEAWKYGPVNRVVYDQIKQFGAKPIEGRLRTFDPNLCKFVEADRAVDQSTAHLLNHTFDYYSQFHAFTLSDLTHESGSPWEQIWQAAEKRAVPGMIIPNRLILDWFRGSGGALKVQMIEEGIPYDGPAYSRRTRTRSSSGFDS